MSREPGINKRDLYAAAEAEARITGMKYCTNCRGYMPVNGGRRIVQSNGRRRWVCHKCLTARGRP